MGTTWSVKISTTDSAIAANHIQSILDTLDAQLSTYKTTSEISRFNQRKQPGCFPISATTATIVKTALDISKASSGAFDITVAPLVDLWGFGPTTRTGNVPEKAMIDTVLKKTGYQYLSLQDNMLCKEIGEIEIDLSAIAKGFAVDQISQYLRAKNYTDHLVEVGGELYASGNKRYNQAWHIGVESPKTSEKNVFQNHILALKNMGIATSGDYRNFIEQNNVRYSHIIDPKSGYPVTHHLASVTVLANSTLLADAWATAMMVLGPEDGLILAEQEKLAVMMLTRSKDGIVALKSSHFKAYMEQLEQL